MNVVDVVGCTSSTTTVGCARGLFTRHGRVFSEQDYDMARAESTRDVSRYHGDSVCRIEPTVACMFVQQIQPPKTTPALPYRCYLHFSFLLRFQRTERSQAAPVALPLSLAWYLSGAAVQADHHRRRRRRRRGGSDRLAD